MATTQQKTKLPSACACYAASRSLLENCETTVLTEVTVKCDGLGDAKTLHYNEAERVAEGVRFVCVTSNQGNSTGLVVGGDAFNKDCGRALNSVDEAQCNATSVSRTSQQNRVCLDQHGIGCNQGPAIKGGVLNNAVARSCMWSSATSGATNPPVSTKTRFTKISSQDRAH